MAFLTGWTYRKAITLSRASGAITNYQMKLQVGESDGVDLSTYTETDPGSLIAITGTKIDFTNFVRSTTDATVRRDFGAGNFGDFTHKLTMRIASIEAGCQVYPWTLYNAAASPPVGAAGLNVWLYMSGANLQIGNEEETVGYTTCAVNLSLNTTYYLTIVRAGTTFSLFVYSDAARTTLVTSAVRTVAATTYRYLCAISNYHSAGGQKATGWFDGLNIGADVDCAGHAASDFDDLRFTTADETTLLDYWIESVAGVTPNQIATVWIEFDSIGTGATTFYMYYGNAGASAVSSGDATFLFFDDFNGAAIDTNKWTNTGTWSETGGFAYKTISGAPYEQKLLLGKTNIPHPCVLRAKAKVSDATKYGWHFNLNWDTAWATQGYLSGHYKDASSDYWKLFYFPNGGVPNNQTNAGITSDQLYVMDLFINATTQNLNVDGVQKATISSTPPASTKPVLLVMSPLASNNYSTYFDYVFARKWTADATEPAWGSWGAETLGVQHYTLTLEPASFSMVGAALRLLNNKILIASPGAYAMVGKDMGMPKTLVPFSLEPGAFAMTGAALSIRRPVIYMRMDPGAFAMVGAAVDIKYSWYDGEAAANYQFRKQRRTF